MIAQHPTVFWGLIASFWIGNLLLLILNVPLIGLWVRILSVPYRLIYPAILFFICMGVYSVQNSMFDVGVAMVCGVIGFIFMKFEYERAPLLLGFVLGPLLEEHFRRALILSRGDFLVFAKSPISATVLLIALALVVYALVAAQLRRRRAAA
jgi:TctA family transporter